MNLFNRAVVAALPLVPRPLVERIAQRYVAGETLAQALETVKALNAEGCMATLDVLGEDVARCEETERTVAEYLRALDGIASRGLDSNISVKLTALGLKIDPQHCRREFARIVEAARRHGNFVRIDMEDSSVTEVTIRIFEEARKKYEEVGLVLQAYLRRSLGDAKRAVALRANVRVCKGIYVEPAEIAFQDREEIRDNYSALVDFLLGEGCYVGIATHDPVLVRRAFADLPALAPARSVRIPDASRGRRRAAPPARLGRAPVAGLRAVRRGMGGLLDTAPEGESGDRRARCEGPVPAGVTAAGPSTEGE